jgi:competence protein ComEC
MKIQFKQIAILLAGDIEQEAEYQMMKKDLVLKADLLKIPHHGSATSSTQAFLERVKPSYAVLSVSERNTGRLPHPEVLKRYERLGTSIFRTDRHGAITVVTDGERIEVETFLKDKS